MFYTPSHTNTISDQDVYKVNVHRLFTQSFDTLLLETPSTRAEGNSRSSTSTNEGQLPTIPPHSTRIEPPRTTISPCKPVVDNVRHKEWYRWKVMHAAFEAPVRSSKHQRAYSILPSSQCRWLNMLTIKGRSHVVSVHQDLLETLVRLSHALAVVRVQSSERFDLVM